MGDIVLAVSNQSGLSILDGNALGRKLGSLSIPNAIRVGGGSGFLAPIIMS